MQSIKVMLDRAKCSFRPFSEKISNIVLGGVVLLGSLLGIKQTEDKKHNTKQIETTGWAFLFSTPIVLFYVPGMPIGLWLGLLLGMLALVNLNETLMLFKLFQEYGVRKVLNAGDYSQWIEDLRYASTNSY